MIVDHERRTRSGGQQRFGRLPKPLKALLVTPPDLGLDETAAGLGQRADRRMQREGRAADVDDAQQIPGAGIVHRAGGAVPRVLVLLEVFTGEQFHRRGLGKRGADRIGAHLCLRPDRAFGETERVGTAPHR